MSWNNQARGTHEKLHEQLASANMPEEVKTAISELASLAADELEIDLTTAGHFDDKGKGEATITIRTV